MKLSVVVAIVLVFMAACGGASDQETPLTTPLADGAEPDQGEQQARDDQEAPLADGAAPDQGEEQARDDEESQMSLVECPGGEEMCWEWDSDAVTTSDCGPENDHEFCWRFKLYSPYVSLNPEALIYRPLHADDRSRAQRLVDLGWNTTVDTPATYFVTSDLGEADLDIVRSGIRAAEGYLGAYGPMRVYVIGSDEDATEPAIADYCAWAYDPEMQENCRSDQGVAIWEIAHYQGSNAFAQHSRERGVPTQAFVIGNPAQFGAEGSKIAAHEYVHVYTAAHQLYQASDEYGLDWPIWLEEGAAEFFALYVAEQNGWLSFEERMSEALNETLELRAMIPNLTIADIAADRERVIDYCGLCHGVLQYATGQWATAWLANKTSVDEVFLGFFPRAYEHGVEQAFELSFGLSIDEFMVEFEDFLSLPRAQQMAILPTP